MKSVIKKIINLFFPNRVYKIRYGIAKGCYRKGGFGFIPKANKNKIEIQFLLNLDLKNKTVFDIGANHGMFSLAFSRAVQPNGRIVSFEPNPIVYQELLCNLEVNDFSNIQTFQVALGSYEYKSQLIFDTTHTGTGSLNNKVSDNFIATNTLEKIDVEVISLDYFCSNNDIPSPEFLKIDVEGFEFDVLKGMENTLENKKPELYIEIHGATFKDKEANIQNIVRLLERYNYNIMHIETDEKITMKNAINAREGHLYCF